MLKKISCIFFALLFLFPANVYASDNSAQSAIVMDCLTNSILYEKNAYEELSIASTTKIMTALLAIESGRLYEIVTVTDEMVNVEGSSLGLRAGDELTLYDLVIGMMLTSGNDSANTVAYFISGSVEFFSKLMNNRAKEIGMNNTYFVTPSGLDEGDHHSTAYDMALLSSVAVESEEFCKIVSMKSAEITINGKTTTVYNHNKLLSRDSDIFGIKTGFTKKAGRCLVSAKKYKNSKLVCVTLNAPDDWNDHISLYNECQKKYIKITLNESVKIPIVGAQQNEINCKYNGEYYVFGKISVKEYHFPFLYLPVKKGDVVGIAVIYCNEKIIERLPIEADEDLNYVIQERSTTSEIYG